MVSVTSTVAAAFQGRGTWAHDPGHRLGVPYSNRALTNRFRGASGARGGQARRTEVCHDRGSRRSIGRVLAECSKVRSPTTRRPADGLAAGGSRREVPAGATAHSVVSSRATQTRQQSDHGYSSLGSADGLSLLVLEGSTPRMSSAHLAAAEGDSRWPMMLRTSRAELGVSAAFSARIQAAPLGFGRQLRRRSADAGAEDDWLAFRFIRPSR